MRQRKKNSFDRQKAEKRDKLRHGKGNGRCEGIFQERWRGQVFDLTGGKTERKQEGSEGEGGRKEGREAGAEAS